MLIREPERRASLEEIAADPWLGEDLNTQPTDFLPLVSRQHVSEEDHALIIQKMVNGNIATKEEILEYELICLHVMCCWLCCYNLLL